jgi:hypothetical protein
MTRLRRVILLSLLPVLVSVVPALGYPPSTIRDLVQKPDQYDGQLVTVTGAVLDYREQFLPRGNPYATFRLVDGGASVAIFAWEHQGLSNGYRVRVTGQFRKDEQVALYTRRHQVASLRIEVLARRSAEAIALCNDGTYSYALLRWGMCSHHGGVMESNVDQKNP